MGGLANLLLKIVINNRLLPIFMVVNICEKIVDYVSALKIDFGVWGGWRNYCLNLL